MQRKQLTQITALEKQAIFQVLSQHYLDPTELLEREYKKNNQIYLAWIDHQLAGLFMVGFHDHFPLTPYKTDVFLGISGSDYRFKGLRIGKLLYQSYLVDASNKEQSENIRILHWWTTASPLVYLAVNKIFANLRPTLLGTFPEEELPYLNYIKETYHYHGIPGNHPDYVLRAIAHNTRYKPEQESYLEGIYQSTQVPVLQENSINEQNGDRILVLCETPSLPIMKTLQQERSSLLAQFETYKIINE